MTPEEYEQYRNELAVAPTIGVGDLVTGDRTLTTGYNIDNGGDVHVYLMRGEIHVVTYSTSGQRLRLWHHLSGPRVKASLLRPSKRAYPDTTDFTFATLMRNADAELTFLGHYDWDGPTARQHAAMGVFKAPTHLDF